MNITWLPLWLTLSELLSRRRAQLDFTKTLQRVKHEVTKTDYFGPNRITTFTNIYLIHICTNFPFDCHQKGYTDLCVSVHQSAVSLVVCVN